MSSLHRVSRIRSQCWILASFFFYSIASAQSAGTDAPGSSPNTNGGPASTNPDVAAQNAAGAGGGSGIPKSTQIIIGVVVSVVVVLAISIGVYIFIAKKRSLDRKVERYEAINAMRSDPNYQATARKYQELSLRKKQRQSRRRKPEVSKIPGKKETPPILPTYDPSTYRPPLSSIDSPGSVPLSSIYMASPGYSRSSYVSVELPPPPALRAANHYRSASDQSPSTQPQASMAYFSKPAGTNESKGRSNHKFSFSDATGLKRNRSTGRSGRTSEEPKKPKPALTKLITNL